MSWDGNSLRSAPEERTKNIYFSNVGAFFSRGSRNENERKVEKKPFLDVWYWAKGKFSYVLEMIRAHFACNAVRAKKKIANSLNIAKMSKLQEICHLFITPFQLAFAGVIISSLYDKENSVKAKKAEKIC